jgi:hypothetical protein
MVASTSSSARHEVKKAVPVEIPRDTPASARRAYATALLLADETGEVPGGMGTLRRAMGIDSTHGVRVSVAKAEAFGLLRRVGVGGGRRPRLFVAARFAPTGCENCGGEVTHTNRHCPRCKQHLRADRSWRLVAVELAVRNLQLHGEVKPASIAVATGVRLFPSRDVEGVCSAVVPWLLSQGLLGEEWQRALAEVLGDSRRAAQMVREMRQNSGEG